MLESLKLSLRIKSDAFDTELQELVDSAKLDLALSGVRKTDESDPLIRRAITIYVKANYGWDNPDAERLQRSYNSLKQHLSLAGDYNAVE